VRSIQRHSTAAGARSGPAVPGGHGLVKSKILCCRRSTCPPPAGPRSLHPDGADFCAALDPSSPRLEKEPDVQGKCRIDTGVRLPCSTPVDEGKDRRANGAHKQEHEQPASAPARFREFLGAHHRRSRLTLRRIEDADPAPGPLRRGR
jgi:hypothetical protein